MKRGVGKIRLKRAKTLRRWWWEGGKRKRVGTNPEFSSRKCHRIRSKQRLTPSDGFILID